MVRFGKVRFKSVAILDEEALLTTLAYVDLNVMAAGMAKTPEDSSHASVQARADHCRELGIMDDVVNQPADRTRTETAAEDENFRLVAARRSQCSVGSAHVQGTQRARGGGSLAATKAPSGLSATFCSAGEKGRGLDGTWNVIADQTFDMQLRPQ